VEVKEPLKTDRKDILMTLKSLFLPIAAVFFILTFATPQVFGQATQAPDPWAGWRFLLGTWTGAGGGQPGAVEQDLTSFTLELDGSVLVRRNHVVFAPKKGEKKGLVHDDLLYVYPTRVEARFHAIYFDNEGHVIRYQAVPLERQNAVRLESEDPPTAMRFRNDFILNPDQTLKATFWMAAPGDTFKVYVSGTVRRKG
jgi:hypothetical protein